MHLRNLFRKSETTKKGEREYGIPTVSASPDLFVAYDVVFRREMGTIAGLAKDTVEEMLSTISGGQGGHLNQGRYYKVIYEKHFRNLDWSWPEHDRWKLTFTEWGRWPVSWPLWDREPVVAIDAKNPRFRLYEILMRTILFRAKGQYERAREETLGITKGSVVCVLKEDSEVVALALKQNPDARPPLFPYDLSIWKPEIPGFD